MEQVNSCDLNYIYDPLFICYCCKIGVNFHRCNAYILDVNECATNPCQNNGTCIDGVNEYNCNCVAGYTGTECEGTMIFRFVIL